ncbi:MAG: GGDEF domain-containing protein, partial [Planctomycetota bacterium]
MGDGLRTIRIATADRSVVSAAQSAVAADENLDGWEIEQIEEVKDLVSAPPAPGDVLIVDAWIKERNVYELLRQLAGRTKCRTFVLVEGGNQIAEPIARFCGATGVLERPISASKLCAAFGAGVAARPKPPVEARGTGDTEFALPAALLAEIAGEAPAATSNRDDELMRAVIDPVTGLFNYPFLQYKLDEEFKRARRFNAPLACAMLGFESAASDDVLRELSSIFLSASRDTDVLGRFDENSFLFLLPNTGPDGAEIMARRVADTAEERRFLDLVGDRIEVAIG